MKPLKVLDLFSGIGGFSLGLERTGGFKTVAFCEKNSYCQKVLRKHWPSVPLCDDIFTLNYKGNVDVITGGYPCEPFSLAGKRKGHADDRYLWPRMHEIITQKRPTWIIIENVIGHLTLGINRVLSDLESEGYTTRPLIIPASAVNAPHQRNRLFIIAYAPVERRQGRSGVNQEERERKPYNDPTPVAHTNPGRCQGERLKKHNNLKGTLRNFPDRRSQRRRWKRENWWRKSAPQPLVCGVAYGFPHRVDRLRVLGAAVVPQVVTQLGQAILSTYDNSNVNQ